MRLTAALAPVGEVFTVAPDQRRAPAGYSLTLQSPLRAKLIGPNRWSVDGTATDYANWGFRGAGCPERED
jgi:5'-nucleotidase